MNSKIKIIAVSIFSLLSVLFISNNVLAATAPAASSDNSTGSGTAGRSGIGINVCKGSDADYAALSQWLIDHPEPQTPTAHLLWQTQYNTFLAAHPGICQTSDFLRLIAKISNILIAISGVFVIFRLLWGAFIMILFPQSESAVTEAKRIMGNAMIGIILVYAAYLTIGTMFSPALWNVQANFPFPFNYLVK